MQIDLVLGSTLEQLVENLLRSETRYPAYVALHTMGDKALPAVHAGLEHEGWQVRKWCAMFLDQLTNEDSLELLKPLLRDPRMDVRLWATHSIACKHCKEGACNFDIVPLLLERIEMDESIRVRRMAVCMLAEVPPDSRTRPVLERIAATEKDRKLLLHAGRELKRFNV